MQLPTLALLAFTAAGLTNGLAVEKRASESDGLIVNTTSGTIHGFIDKKYPNVRNFFGVPYAQAPVGSLRWQPPKDIQIRREILTIHRPPTCMQKMLPGGAYDGPYSDFVTKETQSEDCLYISIYAPAKAHVGSPVPVLVFFFGGGYVAGGSDPPYERPGPWIERSKSHIVVTVNYRLNIFGFPNSAHGSQNFGFLDQRKSVEWVRDNIAAFGGDPKRINLWGQSAGGASVALYPYIWVDDPIVAGLVAHSGVGHSINGTDFTHSNFSAIANIVGCYKLEPEEEFACMRNVEPVVLSQPIAEYSDRTSFIAIADNVTVFPDMKDRIDRGPVANIPMIAGDTSNELAAALTLPEGTLRIPEEALLESYKYYNCPDAAEMNNRINNGHTTYRYLYEGNFTNISPLPYLGAAHSAELPLVFGTHELNGKSTDLEIQVAEAMQDLWLAFIKDPTKDPVAGNVTWPKYDRTTNSLLVIASNDTVTQLVNHMYLDRHC